VRTLFVREDADHRQVLEMIRKIDTPHGRLMYSKRMGIVEPVFGNIRWAKGLDRITVRGRIKANGQWLLYCMVHNIEKICNFGRLAFA
jgi:IS5 family transposase